MYILGHCCKSKCLTYNAVYLYTDIIAQVVYAAGINEQLLGDFIRKHNVRDKIFSRSLVTQRNESL